MSSPSRARVAARAPGSRWIRASAAASIAVLLAACHPGPRPATAPALAPLPQLRHDLDAVLAGPAIGRGLWGVSVQSLAGRGALYALNDRTLLMPASNMKILTLAAAAERLGWDYTYDTRLLAAGPIADGVLQGDLIVVGAGDPSIGSLDDSPTRVFDEWAARLKASGLRRIAGRVLGDGRAMDGEALGFGWSWDDLGESYAARLGALQFHDNSIVATLAPGVRAGDRAGLTVAPPGYPLDLRNEVTTAAPDTPAAVTARPVPGTTRIELRGTVPLGGAPVVRLLSVANPTHFFVSMLRRTLIADGIDVRGPALDLDTMAAAAPSTLAATPLIVHHSPPLSALAVRMMKISQNLWAETFLRTLGLAAGTPTVETARQLAETTLAGWGVPPGGLVMRDGSGLSRYDLVTADALVTVLAHVHADDRLRDAFEATLPVAGRDGTLAHRMEGTPAAGNARAKTGSMSNVRALSGFVRTADGEPLAFAILANNFETPSAEVQQAADAVVARLAAFSRAGGR